MKRKIPEIANTIENIKADTKACWSNGPLRKILAYMIYREAKMIERRPSYTIIKFIYDIAINSANHIMKNPKYLIIPKYL